MKLVEPLGVCVEDMKKKSRCFSFHEGKEEMSSKNDWHL
jgi:hypothetical protein